MRNVIALLIVLTFSSISLLAANQIPIRELPAKPSKELKDTKLTSCKEFMASVLDCYAASVSYAAQLELLGKKLTRSLAVPSYERIKDNDRSLLDEQWKQASELYNTVKAQDVVLPNKQIDEYRKLEYKLRQVTGRLVEKINEKDLEIETNAQYKNLYEQSLLKFDELRGTINNTTIPTLGVSVGAAFYFLPHDDATTAFSPYVGVYLNPATMLGVPDVINFWVDYTVPRFQFYSYPGAGITEATEHNGSMVSLGLLANLPVAKWFGAEQWSINLKPGAGYYWMADKIPNSNISVFLWKGLVLKGELEYVNYATNFPFGVYASVTGNQTDRNLIIPSSLDALYNVDFGNKWIVSLNFGLRFFLTGTNPKQQICCPYNLDEYLYDETRYDYSPTIKPATAPIILDTAKPSKTIDDEIDEILNKLGR